MLEFRRVTDFANTPSFTLARLDGAPDTAGNGGYLVEASSYQLDAPGGECPPLVADENASIINGVLQASPSHFEIPFLVIADVSGVERRMFLTHFDGFDGGEEPASPVTT
jgi:hypothetical protein